MIKLPEVEKAANLTEDFKKSTEVTHPIEDIGVVVLDHKQVVYAGAKILIFLANHNYLWKRTIGSSVVYAGAKILFF